MTVLAGRVFQAERMLTVRKLLFLFLLTFALFSKSLLAATYYVATTGDDTTGDGSEGNPWLTIQKGADAAVSPGDTVIVEDGNYAGQISLTTNSGSSEGTKTVSGVTKANPAVVTVTAHGYSNGDMVAFKSAVGMTQLNGHWFTVANVTANTFELSGTNSTSWDAYETSGTVEKIRPITIKARNRGGATADLGVSVSGWTVYSGSVWVSSSLGIGTGKTAYLWGVGDSTFFEKRESSLAAVNAENDYFYDSTNQLMYLYLSTNPNLATYKSNYLSWLTIKSIDWILIDGFNVNFTTPSVIVGTSTEALGTGTDNIMLQYLTVTYADGLGGIQITSAALNPTSFATVDNCTISYINDISSGSNGHGIKFAANTNLVNGTYGFISNTTIHTFRYQGIQFSNGWAYGDFRNNRIYNIGPNGSGTATGIRTGRPSDVTGHSYVRIYDNNIGNGVGGTGSSTNTGIYLQESSNDVKIYRNYIHDNDWHGIYVFSVTTTYNAYDIKIFNNLFVNNKVSGIRIEESDSVDIFNNTFYENGTQNFSSNYAALSLNDGTSPDVSEGVIFKNNVVWNSTARAIGGISGTSVISDYNDLYSGGSNLVAYGGTSYSSLSSYQSATGNDVNSTSQDPLLTNPPTDLTLRSGSPARSSGAYLGNYGYFTNDYVQANRGFVWDMGAYESSQETMVEGVRIG